MVELINQLIGLSIIGFLVLILAFIIIRRFISGKNKEYLGIAVGVMTLIFAILMIYFWVIQGKDILDLILSPMIYWFSLFLFACGYMIIKSYLNLKKMD